MRGLGLRSRTEPFLAPRSTYLPFIIFSLCGLTGSLFWLSAPWLTCLANLAAALGMFQELDFRRNWVRQFLPCSESQNVLTTLPPQEAVRRRITLVAHLDAHKTPVFYSSKAWQKTFRGLVAGLFLSFLVAALAPVLLKGLAAGVLFCAWLLQATILVLMVHAETTPVSPGACDNASGVAVLLEVARHLTQDPLRHTEVRIVADGAEEVGCYGAVAFAEQHAVELIGTPVLVVDQVGAGNLVYKRRDGLLRTYPCDERLIELVVQSATAAGLTNIQEYRGRGYTDSTVFLQRGVSALTLSARRPDGDAHWHRASDHVQNIEADCLETTHRLVLQTLRSFDGGVH